MDFAKIAPRLGWEFSFAYQELDRFVFYSVFRKLHSLTSAVTWIASTSQPSSLSSTLPLPGQRSSGLVK